MMFRIERFEKSLVCLFSLVTVCFILFSAAFSFSAEIDDINAAIESSSARWVAEENPISALPDEERKVRLGALAIRVQV